MKFISSRKRVKPLCYFSGGLICYSKGSFFIFNDDGSEILLFHLRRPLKEILLGLNFLTARLFRLGIGVSEIFEGKLFFTYQRKIYSFDFESKKLSIEFSFTRGRGPLKFTIIEGVSGFIDGIYFGEYFSNRACNEVDIYQRLSDGNWKNVHTFDEGEINHIHSLVPDSFNQCVWILTGDFDEAAGIWQAKNQFSNMKKTVSGDQRYRSCVAFPVNNRLIYATDSQLEQNSIRVLFKHDRKWKTEKICDIIGSCIYGMQSPNYYIFSTATEPSEHSSGLFEYFMDNRPGPGIRYNKSDIIILDKATLKFEVLTSFKKDWLPYRLFQFGSVQFPAGSPDCDRIDGYVIGTRKIDMSMVSFKD
jgi:hypothetical protein